MKQPIPSAVVVGATTEGMDHHTYFIKCEIKMTLNAKINIFSAFLYQYIDSSVFLEVARSEGLYPPPKSTTEYHKNHAGIEAS